jgi:hypothetical protein
MNGGTIDGSRVNRGYRISQFQTLDIRNVHFKSNYAPYFGGALSISNGTNVTINNNRFSENIAHYGAAVALDDIKGYSFIKFNTFIKNRAEYGGAAVYWMTHSIRHPPSYETNSSGLYHEGKANLNLLNSNKFVDNIALYYGNDIASSYYRLRQHSNVTRVTKYTSNITELAIIDTVDYYGQKIVNVFPSRMEVS